MHLMTDSIAEFIYKKQIIKLFIQIKNLGICDGRVCLNCWRSSQPRDSSVNTRLTEMNVERAERLVKRGMRCGVSFGEAGDIPRDRDAEIFCDSGICFVCKN